ncbi:hypothetical protein GCM10028793_48530 [Nocardiopsis oceani]
MVYPNDPREGGPQPPQGPPPSTPAPPHGPPGAHGAPQGPHGQYPPQGQPHGQYPPQGPPPPGEGYPPQGPAWGPGQPPQGPYGEPWQPGPEPKRRSALPWVLGGGAAALVLVAGVVGVVFLTGDGGSAGSDLEGLETFEGVTKDHVDPGTTVDYDQHPPAGGDHYAVWQDCGVYDEPVVSEAAVHSQEHGAVWITYDPALGAAEVGDLDGYYEPGSYVIVSPMEDLPAPVVASAWGAQIQLEGADDERLDAFLREYERSEDVPEPGGPCSGSFGGTQAEFEEGGAEGADDLPDVEIPDIEVPDVEVPDFDPEDFDFDPEDLEPEFEPEN